MEQSCDLCEALTVEWESNHPSEYGYSYLSFGEMQKSLRLHEDCPKCPAPGPVPSPSADHLCSVCKHIKLTHIATCGIDEIESKHESVTGLNIEFHLGSLGELRQRSRDEGCALCTMLIEPIAMDKDVDEGFRVALFVILQKPSLVDVEGVVVLNLVVDRVDPAPSDLDRTKYLYTHTWIASTRPPERLISQLPRIPEKVEWETVSTWLEECPKRHSHGHRYSQYQNTPLPYPPGFRLVDTRRGCVVTPAEGCKYATLSYAWGDGGDTNEQQKQEDLQATTGNIKDLEAEGVLFRESTPATIQDAMLACRKIGVDYLWVDRICILQDEEQNKAAQIDAMGDIYGHSEITLVSLHGDVYSGLPGISRDRQDTSISKTYEVQGLHFIQLHERYNVLVQRSKWASRGWTFQEALFSQRLLLFSDQAVFLECHDEWRRERERKDTIWNRENPDTSAMFVHLSYRNQVDSYTQRDLSIPSDILRAFSGILNSRQGYFGVPFCEFHRAILWQTKDGKYTPRPTGKGDVFPSWSWCSVIGPVEMMYREDYSNVGPRDYAISLAVWAIPCFDNGKQKAIPRILHHQTSEKAEEWDTANTISGIAAVQAWKGGCFAGKFPSELNVDGTWRQCKSLIKTMWPSLDPFCNDALGISQSQTSSTPSPAQESMESFLSNDIDNSHMCGKVLVYTQSLQGRIALPPRGPDGFATDTLHLKTPNGDEDIGWLSPQATNQDRLYEIYQEDPDTTIDIIALALNEAELRDVSLKDDPYINGLTNVEEEACWPDSGGNFFDIKDVTYSDDEKASWREDAEKEDEFLALMVEVMVVETRAGISTRLGVGRTFLKTWINASPEFRTFCVA